MTENERTLMEQMGIDHLLKNDPRFPKRLSTLKDSPSSLYIKGTLLKDDSRCLAIVGTRNATLYGIEMAKKISRELAKAGFTIISGLARGIDTAAHQGAMETGRTLAVLGSGLAEIYPIENVSLANEIGQKGALLSEYSPSTRPKRYHFPQRNRIVSGMSMGTILIEAPLKSGAMLTAERTLLEGKPVFVLPGRADNENYRGNHALIKQGKGLLIETSQDVASFFNDLIPFSPQPPQKCLLEEEERKFLEMLPSEEFSIDEIIQRVRLPIHQLHVLLMGLILKKIIKEYPGKIYKKY